MDVETKIARLHTILRKTLVHLHNGLANGASQDDIARGCGDLCRELDRAMADPAPKLSAFKEWDLRECGRDMSGSAGYSDRRDGWNGAIDEVLALRKRMGHAAYQLGEHNHIESLREPDHA